jgi:hypothetical protein
MAHFSSFSGTPKSPVILNRLLWPIVLSLLFSPMLNSLASYPVVLSQSSVSPSFGNSSTTFTFQTTYSEVNGSAPTTANVYVDNVPYAMIYVSGSYSTGALFQAQMTLPSGNHTFFFVFSDSQSSWADPVAPQAYATPTVGAGIHFATPSMLVGDPPDMD